MTRLFKRTCKVTAYRAATGFVGAHPGWFEKLGNGIEITDLRIQFEIEKDVGSEPNKCEVTITNLAARTRAELEAKPLIVEVAAGYDGVARHLFTGDLMYASSQLDGVDWETKLQLADGGRAYRSARIAKSYAPNTPRWVPLVDAITIMGLSGRAHAISVVGAIQADSAWQLATGQVVHGRASDELTRMLTPLGYSWSIQNGLVQVLKNTQTRPEPSILVNQSTGLIGSPERGTPDKTGKPPSTNFKMLLYPELTPAGTVKLESRGINGVFRVQKVKHTGDTHGDGEDWISSVEARPV